ncbi:MAG: hypothetical protein ACOYLQ_10075 [Hyphomicrobiaceae bacterium]
MRSDEELNGASFEGRVAVDGIESPPWPVLTEEALYGIAGEVATAATLNSEADPAAVLATFLTLAGIAFGRTPWIKVADDDHHARLFCVIVGRSARGRKGTSEGPVRKIWEVAEHRLGEPLSIRPGPMSSGEGLIYAIRDGSGNGDDGVPDKRLLMIEGEFAAPLRAMRREGNTLSAILRTAWDGKTLEPLTKNHPIKATRPHVGIIAHITEAELGTLLSQVDIFNGFANRFLWWCVRRQKLLPLASGLSDADIADFGAALASRVRRSRQVSQIEFTPTARNLYTAVYPRLTEDQDGLYGVVTSRAEVQVIRIALIYACLDASSSIEVEHIQAALAVWNFCDASAKRLFGCLDADPLATRILHILKREPRSTTELHRELGNHTKQGALQAVLERLQRDGKVEAVEVETGGRPRTDWRIRPSSAVAKNANLAN